MPRSIISATSCLPVKETGDERSEWLGTHFGTTTLYSLIGASEPSAVQGMGLISLRSSFEHGETIARLEAAIRANGMHLVGRFDHASAAAEVGADLRPTVVLYYNNALDFVAIIRHIPPIAIDLPFRALVWEDRDGDTWVTYDDLDWLASRHGVPRDGDLAVASFAVRVDAIVRKAASPPYRRGGQVGHSR